MCRIVLFRGLGGVAAWFMMLCASSVVCQTIEEHDRDEPPASRPAPVPAETVADVSAAERRIIDQTNAFRQQQQLAALEPNDKLLETAQYFADFMARTGKYGHAADGKRPSERAENHGYKPCIIAENIGYQYRSSGFTAEQLAKRFVSGWKNSPGHRKNMLDPDVTETAVAMARKPGSPAYFAVQLVGRPKSKAIGFRVRNVSKTATEYTVRRRGSEKTFDLPPRMARRHQRCRPTTIAFRKPETEFHVEDGAWYTVDSDDEGSLTVGRSSGAEAPESADAAE